MDWDFLIPARDAENFRKLNEAFADEFDSELEPMTIPGTNLIQTYQTKYGILQFHLGIPGVPSFDDAEKRSVIKVSDEGDNVRCLCGRDLLASKKATNRPHDQQDIAYLEELERLGHLGGDSTTHG